MCSIFEKPTPPTVFSDLSKIFTGVAYPGSPPFGLCIFWQLIHFQTFVTSISLLLSLFLSLLYLFIYLFIHLFILIF